MTHDNQCPVNGERAVLHRPRSVNRERLTHDNQRPVNGERAVLDTPRSVNRERMTLDNQISQLRTCGS